jgi:hypothetical protein
MRKPESHDATNTQGAAAGSAAALGAAVEAALADLVQRLPAGFGAFERVELERIRKAGQRLLECALELDADDLMVRGSTGQRRAHPLLKTEQDLRREISDCLAKLTFRVEQRATLDRLKTAHAAAREVAQRRQPEPPK